MMFEGPFVAISTAGRPNLEDRLSFLPAFMAVDGQACNSPIDDADSFV
jgi:hypothetical protein